MVARLYHLTKNLAGGSWIEDRKNKMANMAAGFVHMLQKCAVNTPLRCVLLAFEYRKDLAGEVFKFEDDSDGSGDEDIYGETGTKAKGKARKVKTTVGKAHMVKFVDDMERKITTLVKKDANFGKALLQGLQYPGLLTYDENRKQTQVMPFEFRESDVDRWAAEIAKEKYAVADKQELFDRVLQNEACCKYYFAQHHAKSKGGTLKLEKLLGVLPKEDFRLMVDFGGKVTDEAGSWRGPMIRV